MQLQACILLALWPNSAVTTAIHSPQDRNHGSQWNQRSSRTHHHRRASARSNEGSCSRELSAKDQLDIIRLGFIPISARDDDDGDASKPSNNDMTQYFNSRGGSMDSNIDNEGSSCSSRQLSAKDQLDIIRLGFIPSRGGSMNSTVASSKSKSIHPLAFASIMAFLAGYSHVLCIKKFNCYAAMMTGNVISLSIALGEKKWKDGLWRLSLIGSYFVGAASVKSIELACQKQSSAFSSLSQPRKHLKIVAPLVAAVFATADRAVGKSTILSILALGYGMVYASANQALNATITQLLTGHITKLGSAASDRFLGPARQWNKGAGTSACILGSFLVGGSCGAHILSLVPNEFPLFTVLGIVYALLLALF